MKWKRYSESETKWIPLNESFIDGMKSMWKKIKDAFKDLPLARLVGKNGKEVRGYVHDYSKSNNTCSLYVKEGFAESAAIAAVAASNAMRHSNGDDGFSYRRPEPKRHVQQFSKGDKATLIGSDIGENISATVIGYENCGDIGIYELQLE